MIAYNYNQNGEFIGIEEAQESPLEPGIFLIPAYATTITPPVVDEGEIQVWNGDNWIILKLPQPPASQTQHTSNPKEEDSIISKMNYSVDELKDENTLIKKALDELLLGGGL